MIPLLELRDLQGWYGKSHILQGVSLSVGPGETVALLGRNGAGKTTTLRAAAGLLPHVGGTLRFAGEDIAGRPSHVIARSGLALVPENRGIFAALTVEENLRLALRKTSPWGLDTAWEMFPSLAQRRRTPGGKLSGGEQQMLSIARALATGPRLLMLDEPTEGLAPVIVDRLVTIMLDLKRQGLPMLLVEQSLDVCRAVADRHAILDDGQIVWSGDTAALVQADAVVERHLTLERR
jgi:branched-chain amino acid transport system ATP-binding protein